jgi:amino acid adenylation domain-containing protein
MTLARASFAQQGMWVSERASGGGSGVYHMPLALSLHGSLAVPALLRACADVVGRHPVLSSVVTRDGNGLLLKNAAVPPPVTVEDQPAPAPCFDLENGPLARFTLSAAGPGEHVLRVAAHHLVFDGISKDILVRDLALYYRAALTGTAPDLPPLPVSFPAAVEAEYAAVAAELSAAREFWAQRWHDPAEIVLPGQSRLARQAAPGAEIVVTVDALASRAIDDAAREAGATRFEVLLSAAHTVLHRYGNDDVAVAVDVSTRTDQARDLIGPFVNELPVFSRAALEPTFPRFARAIRAELRAAYRFRRVPLGQVAGLPPRAALTPVSMSYRRRGDDPVFPGLGIRVDRVLFGGGARNALHIQVVDGPAGLDMRLRFNPSAVPPAAVHDFAGHLLGVLRDAAANPAAPLAELGGIEARVTRRPEQQAPAPADPAEENESAGENENAGEDSGGEAAAPGGVTDSVRQIWCEVLGLADIGLDEDLFDLGGHSLTITQITTRIAETLDAEVPLDVFFDRPTINGVVEAITQGRREDGDEGTAEPLQARPAGVPVPLSFAQERLWFLHQFDPQDASYNVYLVRRLRGVLDVGALTAAIDGVAARHETLRTSFANVGGEPAAVLHPAGSVPVERVRVAGPDALGEAQRLVAERSNTPFGLSLGPPVRVTLIELAPDDHVLCMILHHIICDGWSLNVLFDEISALYRARVDGSPASLPPLRLQYGDFAWWQRTALAQGERAEQALAYWRRQLADPPQPELPGRREPDSGDRTGRAGRAAVHAFRLPPDVTAALERIAADRGATLFMALLAAYHVLLAQRSGEADVLAGTVWAVRDRAELEPLIGDLTDTLVLRGDLSGNPSFVELLDRTRQTMLDAHAHREVPFERLISELELPHAIDRNPLLSSMLIMHSGETDVSTRDHIGELRADLFDAGFNPAKFDLLLECWQETAGLSLSFTCDTSVSDPDTAQRLAVRFAAIATAIAAGPERQVSALRALPAAERRQLIRGWNDTRREVAADTVIDLIGKQAAARPEAVAVTCDGQTLTYAELMAQAAAVAGRLRAAGTRPGSLVAVCAEPSVAAVAAMLGVMLAGAGYLPVDPDYPAARTSYVLQDSGVSLVLAPRELKHLLPPGVIWLEINDAAASDRAVAPVTRPEPAGTAYVLYTSGSTGRPKGVMIPHSALANFLAGMRELLRPGPADVWLGLTSVSFDISALELYLPLVSGGQVVIAGQQVRRDGTELARLAEAHGITHIQATPTGWRMLLDGGIRCEAVTALVGGEALPVPLASELSGRTRRLLNMYGPTETTIWSTAWEVPAQPETVLIGRPIVNTTCYVLDAEGELAPPGTPGELFIGGAGVAAGYLGHPALTAERFPPDPYGQAGARLYRTGDRARWTADGQLEFLGRADNQVKVRGFRIELGEVEASLLEHPLVEQACVAAVVDGAGDPRLVAYVVSAAQDADSATLGGYLAGKLPYYMLPGAFVRLAALPLTPNGKVDRRALPAPGPTAATGGAPPRTPTERLVAGVFAEVLGQPQPAVSDDFFALGGHSLLATKVVAKLSTQLGLSVPVRDLFNHPAVGQFAAAIDRLRADAAPAAPLVPRPAGEAPPLSFGQERLWFLQRLDPEDTSYNMYLVRRLRGTLDATGLASAVTGLAARHEALRTSFPEVDGAPVAVVHPPASIAVEQVDCGDAEDPPAAARLAVTRRVNTPFDLAAAPPIRVSLIRLGRDDHVLCIAAHHIIGDAPSLNVMLDDLARIYEARLAGTEPGLVPLPVQFGDFAWWQRSGAEDGEAAARSAAYWRQQLADPPPLELNAGRAAPDAPAGQAGMHVFRVDREVTAGLERAARDGSTTLFTVLLAAYQVLLARHTGRPDILVGTSWATRDRIELEPVVGYLTSTLVFRGNLAGDPTFAELVADTRQSVLQALDHGDVPFERVISELNLPRDARNLLMPTMVLLHTPAVDGVARTSIGNLTATQFDTDLLRPKFDLALEGWQDDDGLLLVLHYDTGLLTAAAIAGYAARFAVLLAATAAEPGRRLSALPLLTAADRAILAAAAEGLAADRAAAWRAEGPAGAADAGTVVPGGFAAMAARMPTAPAVTCGTETLTYAGLRALAGRLAAALARGGAEHGEVIGVCLPRSAAAIGAPFAVWRTGAAYLPLDPDYPDERIVALLTDSAARFVITSERLAGRLAPLCPSVTLLIADEAPEDRVREDDAPELAAMESGRAPAAGDAAYLIYTSGSTGQPHGVLVEHGSLAARVSWMAQAYQLHPGDVVAQFASLSFDTHAEEIYPALLAGAALLLLPEGPASLPDVLRTPAGRAVTVLDLPTAYWHRLTEMIDDVAWPDGLRLVILGGEQVHAAAVARWRARFGDRVRLVNTYGPTEATIIATACDLVAADTAGRPAIGRPVSQTTAYVLDHSGQLVPPGAPGELCLGGGGLARCYLGDPVRTADRFVPDPFGPPGARLYRTGDRVRWRDDQALEFLGRLDNQVKVRGFRVEPGEVEAALMTHPAVGQAVVVADAERLVAYLTAGGKSAAADRPGTAEGLVTAEAPVTVQELRRYLAATLPAHLIPSAFVTLDALPLTVNGKVDTTALPPPPPERPAVFVPPRTDAEQLVAATWADVLGPETGPVGATDDFFALGGHSLLAARVAARLRAALELEVPIRTVFDHPVLAELAAAVEDLLVAELAGLSDDEAAALVGGEGQ